jgi:CheY-like chemotaxis protein
MSQATKILIVEDDPLIAELYAGHFRSKGVDVVLREDGERAIEYLKGDVPDAALLDLMLPRVNGLDILKFVRSEERLRNLPCIVLTNAYLGNMVHEAWKAGTDRCLTKVFSKPPQVLEILLSLLAEKRAVRRSGISNHSFRHSRRGSLPRFARISPRSSRRRWTRPT